MSNKGNLFSLKDLIKLLVISILFGGFVYKCGMYIFSDDTDPCKCLDISFIPRDKTNKEDLKYWDEKCLKKYHSLEMLERKCDEKL